MNFVSKFNHSLTSRDCLHCAILKTLYNFKEKRAHKAYRQEICNFFLQNVQKEEFQDFGNVWKQHEIHQIEKTCRIKSKISNRDKNTTLMIFLFYHYCWSLLWLNYWRSLMLWNSTSCSRLKLTVQIQLALHPCDPFLINNRNITSNSAEKCFLVLNVKL